MIYSAGLNRRDVQAQILFAGIQSVHRKAYTIQRADLVLVDEAHLIPRKSEPLGAPANRAQGLALVGRAARRVIERGQDGGKLLLAEVGGAGHG